MAELLTDRAAVRRPSRERWHALLASDPRSLPSQRPDWLDAVCAVDRYRDQSMLFRSRDGRELLLPVVARTGPRARRHSLPYGWGPAGLVAEDGVLLEDDVRRVLEDLEKQSRAGFSVRPSPLTAAVWEKAVPPSVRRSQHTAQSVDLSPGFPALWTSHFTSQGRRGVRRAEKEGVTVERDDKGRLLPVYQDLYRRSVDRWARASRRPVVVDRWWSARREPPHKVPAVAERLGPDLRTYVAYVREEPAAAIVVAFGPRSAAYWRGAMDERFRSSYATYLLHRLAIEDACQRGLGWYHMGDSAPGSTLARFKKQFGALELPYSSYHLEPRSVALTRRAGRRLTQLALTRVPTNERPVVTHA